MLQALYISAGGVLGLGSGGSPCRVRRLAELKRQMSEFGEVEMAGIQEADHQRGECL